MRCLALLLCACAAETAGKKCRGPDVSFTMESYAYIARLRCVDGRAVAKDTRVTTGVRRDGCYTDIMQIKCEDDPKWTRIVFVQGAPPPRVPLGFKQLSEAGYIQYTAADAAISRNDFAAAAAALERAAASDPDIAFIHRLHGFALRKLGHDHAARIAYARAVELAPGALTYRLELAALLVTLQDPTAPAVLQALDRDAPPDWPHRPLLQKLGTGTN